MQHPEIKVMFKLEKPVLIKLLIIAAIFLIAPYAVPFSFEFVLMADIMGLEALILFLIFHFRHALSALLARSAEWRSQITASVLLLANLYIFQPRVFVSHAAGSSFILLFACSLFLALALWVPAIFLSSAGFA
ncbi:MAG: hypothetical protein DHS20C12_10540 [Pseudohongiella sp.]|nr:MAG: hypothetical protein DHS20C12_10540 [Pseudohongiella sp.]